MNEKQLLEKLRGHLAFAKQVEPYKIFRNQELNLLLINKPKTLEDLSKIKGFPAGGSRVTKWGTAIVAIFNPSQDVIDFDIHVEKDGEELVATPRIKPINYF